MKRTLISIATLVLTIAVAQVAITSAAASEKAFGAIQFDTSDPCPLTFTYDGAIPGSGYTSDLNIPGECWHLGAEMSFDNSDLDVDFGTDGSLELVGRMDVTVGVFPCWYEAQLVGTWNATTPKSFVANDDSIQAVGPPFLLSLCSSVLETSEMTGVVVD